ncbi:MAG: hypothetical protein ABIG61_07910 [Planctomycetota bacterium]
MKESDDFKIIGSNERSCLGGNYCLQNGGNKEIYKPRFQIRGINPCESLARHTPEQIEHLIDRMANWRMNTLIIHLCYGYKFHADQIEHLCRELGIEIKYYVQTSLLFLSEASPSIFAHDMNGNPHTKHLDNSTRLCVSEPAAVETFRNGARRFFSSNRIPPNAALVLMDADGCLFCQCPKCRYINPVQQWSRLFNIAIEEAQKSGKNLSIEYLCYLWRYELPEDFSIFDRVSGVMFDTHPRFRWKAINEPHNNMPYHTEAQVDPTAEGIPLNCYLYKQLKKWRQAYSGQLYVFENLMIQNSMSAPQPYTPQLLKDLDLYEDLGIDGIVYEAFEPGIESFSEQIGLLSRAMWSKPEQYNPTKLEEMCSRLDGLETSDSELIYRFNSLLYLATDKFDALAALDESGYDDPLLYEYLALLRVFIKNRTFQNFCDIVSFLNQHRERFDWMNITFKLAKALPHAEKPRITSAAVREFLDIDKLWDLMEKMSDPVKETARIIESLLDCPQ